MSRCLASAPRHLARIVRRALPGRAAAAARAAAVPPDAAPPRIGTFPLLKASARSIGPGSRVPPVGDAPVRLVVPTG